MLDEAQFAELSEEQCPSQDVPVPCERLIGAAGTGKTHLLRIQVKADPKYGRITATTGIAAVNLDAITINSTLGYSDTPSLKDIYLSGRLSRTLHSIALAHRRLIVEEYSMADAAALDLWYRGVQEANRYKDVREPLGILLVGDLAQLPPVKAQWCFTANCWPEFAANTTRLDKVWRQGTGPFLDALNLLREGQGGPAMEMLTAAGVRWHTAVDTEFDGTTVLPKNDMVNRYNAMGLDRVRAPLQSVYSRRWGKTPKEWSLIPERFDYKIGALVMVLSNSQDFSHVNGDTGSIVDFDGGSFGVELKRTGKVERIGAIVRHCDQLGRPDNWEGEFIERDEDYGEYIPQPHYRERVHRYVLGQIRYYPLRLAYASTVHKSQGLTLDKIQVDIRDHFFAQPAMEYVALSRCRTLEGLRIVGMKETFVKHCKMDERIRPWL